MQQGIRQRIVAPLKNGINCPPYKLGITAFNHIYQQQLVFFAVCGK
jgi:hypothetical protein